MSSACVILNYNDAENTIKLAEKLCSYSCLDHIILVDNASADLSAKALKDFAKEKDRVTVVLAEKNGGYGSGNNLGVSRAWTLGAECCLIANPDVEVSERCVCRLVECMKKTGAAAVSARMSDMHYGTMKSAWPQRGFWAELCSMGPVCRRLFPSVYDYPADFFKGNGDKEVFALHGSMLLVDTEKFLDAGGYDENIFLYGEEAVLARRLWSHGYKTRICLDEAYVHAHSASISRTYADSMKRQRLREASELYYMKEYLGIGKARELFARAFFSAIRMEIAVYEFFGR